MAKDKTLYCSFCGKSKHEVSVLILGPSVLICSECTFVCLGVIMAKDESCMVEAMEVLCEAGIASDGAAAEAFAKRLREMIGQRLAKVKEPGFMPRKSMFDTVASSS